MINFLSKYIFVNLEDITYLIVAHALNDKGCFVGYPFCRELYSHPIVNINQPFLDIALIFFNFISGNNYVLAINLLILTTLVLNFSIPFWFFKKLFGKKDIAFILALITALSPHVIYSMRSHLDLMQIWVVFPLLYLLLLDNSKFKSIKTGFWLAFITFVSNYLGFGALILTGLFTIRNKQILNLLKTIVIFLVFCLPFVLPYVRDINNTKFTDINQNTKGVFMEDFVSYTSRPWYYLMPSVDNPLVGNVSKRVFNAIQNRLGENYAPYVKEEHSASYLGWINIIFAVLGIKYVFSNYKKPEFAKFKYLLEAGILLAIFTMPPYVEVLGLTLYLPSYLIGLTFSMFRVLARFGAIILPIFLIFTGFGYVRFQEYLRTKASPPRFGYISKIVFFVVLMLSLADFYIPPKITKLDTVPNVYTFIRDNTKWNSPVVVYPSGRSLSAQFWQVYYQRPLINARGINNVQNNFDSVKFTKELITNDGLVEAKRLGAKYLVYFPNADKKSSDNLAFFGNNPNLRKLADFENSINGEVKNQFIKHFISLEDQSNNFENSAMVFEIL